MTIKNIPTDCAVDELATQDQIKELINTIKETAHETQLILEQLLTEIKKANIHLELASEQPIENEED